MGRYPSGQRGQTVNLLAYAYAGSNPALPTIFIINDLQIAQPFKRLSLFFVAVHLLCTFEARPPPNICNSERMPPSCLCNSL